MCVRERERQCVCESVREREVTDPRWLPPALPREQLLVPTVTLTVSVNHGLHPDWEAGDERGPRTLAGGPYPPGGGTGVWENRNQTPHRCAPIEMPGTARKMAKKRKTGQKESKICQNSPIFSEVGH